MDRRSVIALLLACAAAPLRGTEADAPSLVVLDLELTGDTGGPEMQAQHAARLELATRHLREGIAASGSHRVLDTAPAAALIERLKSQQLYWHECNGCHLDVGRALHADRVLVSWVYRVSALILSLTYELHGVASGQILARRSFDFRGDNDTAWLRAVDAVIRDLATAAAGKPSLR